MDELITPYHAKYYAHQLTRLRSEYHPSKIGQSLFDATVDLNPHQIDAALFALKNPLARGVLLADEVGLGKTIEAGLILSQSWAERKRKILVICPASLRKQWANELKEKFNIESVILDSKTYKDEVKSGNDEAFVQNGVVILSYNYAARLNHEIKKYKWDLAVVDEAHRLRNTYKKENKTGNAIKFALEDVYKLLLTATPLQNSLLELFGLSLFIDEHLFGDLRSFKMFYGGREPDLNDLQKRISPYCQRTLRKHVLEYVPYTNRKPLTISFDPQDSELDLYKNVSEFLRRENTYSIPDQGRHLITLLVRKILASSTSAVASTLTKMKERLEELQRKAISSKELLNSLVDDEEINDDELFDNGDDTFEEPIVVDQEALKAEIDELNSFIEIAKGIKEDSRAKSLLTALTMGFDNLAEMGAAKKVLIFTESRKTQDYLVEYLAANGHNNVVLFNGTNTSEKSKLVYKKWIEENQDTGRISGSKTADMRNALVEYFKNEAEIMIATESAAEGVNLQFCSLLINYDLPWNPQRVEQRIGRCHRYGQKFDVVVVNFLNNKNKADQRVYELLRKKFKLFEGMFGSSDHILGTLDSGVDFENRIFKIYQTCRSEEEINNAFDALQTEMEESISERMSETRQILMEHFDEEVHQKLKVQLSDTKAHLDEMSEMFWGITKLSLKDDADFNDEELSFKLSKSNTMNCDAGIYHLVSKTKENIEGTHLYRLGHTLGEKCISYARSIDTPPVKAVFNISEHPKKISVIEDLKGKSGVLKVLSLNTESFRKEENLILIGCDTDESILSEEVLSKLFKVNASIGNIDSISTPLALSKEEENAISKLLIKTNTENNQFFDDEVERLDRWADDVKGSLEQEIKDIDKEIKFLKTESRKISILEEKVKAQRSIKDLEKKRNKKRQQLYQEQDRVETEKDKLISKIEGGMSVHHKVEELFTIQWEVK
ncbi:MAG: DEAD/DEAH box helicase family protein [Bacteriovoracaceae bacterium]|nr:DEAD/DEAH box helicase family protein [Bacteriovoracaceae bacterium]